MRVLRLQPQSSTIGRLKTTEVLCFAVLKASSLESETSCLWILGSEVRNQGAARPSSRGALSGSSPGLRCAAPSLPLPSQARLLRTGPTLLRYDLTFTNRICKDSVSSSAHGRRSWGLEIQHIFSGRDRIQPISSDLKGQNDHIHTRPCPAGSQEVAPEGLELTLWGLASQLRGFIFWGRECLAPRVWGREMSASGWLCPFLQPQNECLGGHMPTLPGQLSRVPPQEQDLSMGGCRPWACQGLQQELGTSFRAREVLKAPPLQDPQDGSSVPRCSWSPCLCPTLQAAGLTGAGWAASVGSQVVLGCPGVVFEGAKAAGDGQGPRQTR